MPEIEEIAEQLAEPLTATENVEVFDLEKELQIPTQQRTFDFSEKTTSAADEILNENADSKRFDDDFDIDKLKETLEEKAADNFEALYDTSTLAPAIVDGVDAVMQQVFPIFYEKSAFTDDERKLVKILSHKLKNQRETTLTEKDLSLQAACAEYEEYVSKLPLTANEKKQLVKPLSEMLKDVNLATTPTNALILAALLIALPRLLPLGINKFIKNKSE